MRIVSLLPGATETLCQLGLLDQIVGVSHECDYPREVQTLPRVTRSKIPEKLSSKQINDFVSLKSTTETSLYDLDRERINLLKPDLMVTQDLCGVCAVSETAIRETCEKTERNVSICSLNATSLRQFFHDIERLGTATQVEAKAKQLSDELQGELEQIRKANRQTSHRPSVVLLEWLDPLFCAGHWTPELIEISGGVECIGRANQKSTTFTWERLLEVDPEVLILACCGFSIDRMKDELQSFPQQEKLRRLRAIKTGNFHLLDGSAYLNRPGPRLIEAAQILASIIHPDLHPRILNPQSTIHLQL